MVWSSYETSGDALSPARAAVDAAIPARTAIRAMRLRKGRERGYGILPLLLAKGGANFMPESGVRRSRRAGTERALHQNAVHPAAVLEADILDGADHAKPLRRVQPDRRSEEHTSELQSLMRTT